jgi:signal transduction histidine kinase
MKKEKIDQRVVKILRWSILLQVAFIAVSTFSPRAHFRGRPSGYEIDPVSLIPIFLMAGIAGMLFIKKIASNINKKSFLIIQYALALSTVVARQYFSFSIGRMDFPIQRFSSFRWDAIFFLIIPVVFIAWQYSMREVLVYSLVMTIAETLPSLIQGNADEIIFTLVNFLGSLARAGIFIIVGWIENRLVTLLRTQQDELRQANRKLRKYALSAEKLAQTQERNRLARELHDTLAHTLSSSAVQLEAIKVLFDRDPDQARDMISQTLENTKDGLVETRRALADLRSSELESFGLNQAIRNMANSAAQRGGFNIKFSMDKDLDMLPEDITHCLYRTAQESLENILRHANASTVSISLVSEENKVNLVIKDNGTGFQESDIQKEHFGIRGMRERVEMLGGELTIDSDPGSGTNVLVELVREND